MIEVKILLTLLLGANGILPLLVEYRGKDGRRTKWGKAAIVLGLSSAVLAALITVIDQTRQQRSTAQSIDHQTRVIASLRQLVAPIDEQLTANLFFKVAAEQVALVSLTRYLEASRQSRYLSLPRVSSAVKREAQLAMFLDSDLTLSYCKSPSCMDNMPYSKPPNDVDLEGKIKVHKQLYPEWLEYQTHHIDIPLAFEGERGVLYDSVTKTYTISFRRNRKQTFFQNTERIQSADDLTRAYVFVQRIEPAELGVELGSVVLFKKNGRFLQASNFKTISVKNHTCEDCDDFKFFVSQFPSKWMP